jgi:hypothetical protein
VQLVAFPGPITTEEEAAVRLKLDQKISAGRKQVLFHLSGFPVADQPARLRFMSLVSYCLERGVTVGVCGAEQSRWPLLRLDGKRQPQLFVTEGEALATLTAAPETAPIHSPGEAPQDDTEKQIHLRSIEALLNKYESFQNTGELDPFGLERVEVLYRKDRSRESLIELDKAIRDLPRRRQHLQKLITETERLAEETLEFTFHRKLPVTPAEIEARAKSAEQERDSMSREREQLTADIAFLEKKIETIQKAAREVQTKLELKLRQANENLARETEATARLRDQMTDDDAKEMAQVRDLEIQLK